MAVISPFLPWQNLNGMMVAVAELLSMKIPNSYEVLFPENPTRPGIEPKKGEAEGPGEYGGKTPWGPRGVIVVGVSDPLPSCRWERKESGRQEPRGWP